MKLIFISTSRADFSIYRPLALKLKNDSFFEIEFLVTGMNTIGPEFPVAKELEELEIKYFQTSAVIESPGLIEGLPKSLSNTSDEVGKVLLKNKPDGIVILGDRFEMLAVATVCASLQIPLIHMHGGELTLGAFDNKFRYAITQLSDYHFVSCEENFKRVNQVGISEDRILNCGSLSLHGIHDFLELNDKEFFDLTGIGTESSFVLVVFHPETKSIDRIEEQTKEFAKTLNQLSEKIEKKILISLGNYDPKGNFVRDELIEVAKKNKNIHIVREMGSRGFFSALKKASIMLGNSSSGIIEAASFNLPVVNIGERQLGRAFSQNVIHCDIDSDQIINACKEACGLENQIFDNIYYQEIGLDLVKNFFKNTELAINYEFHDL